MKQLRLYTDRRFKSLNDSLLSYHQVDDPEVLHSIRLNVKKIKSVLNLLQYGLGKFNGHKYYVPLRTIFRKAGEIRQSEVIYKLLLQHQIGGITDSQIPNADQAGRLILAFKNQVSEFVELVADQRRKLKKYLGVLPKKKGLKYLTIRRQEVKRLLCPDFQPATLHKTRKIIKEILFLHWMKKQKKATAFFKKAENIIGQWHDKQVLLGILSTVQYKDQAAVLMAVCQEDLVNLKSLIDGYYGKSKKSI